MGLVLTFIAIRIGRRLKVMDQPGLRKVHDTPISRLGGPAIALAMLVMTLCVSVLDNRIGEAFREQYVQVTAMLAGAVFLLLVGLVDDCRGVRAKWKLLAQLVAATVAWSFGLRIETLSLGALLSFDLGWLSLPVTILWIVAITNTINLIDGLDGLAAGICTITCTVIVAFAIYHQQALMAVLMLGMMGSLCGFLVFNFNPARIFMGDSGTYFLGFMIATGSVISATKTGTAVGLALPALALGVPIFDTLFSIIRRSLERRSWFAPDRSHIHHKLLEMGLRHHHAVIILYGVTLMTAGLGMFLMITRDAGTLTVLIGVVIVLLLLFRAVGLVRVRQVLVELQRNIKNWRQARSERRYFEATQMQLRDAKSFRARWQALCDAAEEMGFLRMAILRSQDGGNTRTILSFRSAPATDMGQYIRMEIPVSNDRAGFNVTAEMDVRLDGSLESVGRRVAMFGRLIDENGVGNLGGGNTSKPVEPDRPVVTVDSPGEWNPTEESVA